MCSIENGKIIKTLVTPSQRISERKHSLWILFNEASDIVTSFCTCTAGFSSCCNYVVAALYKIEYANEKGLTNSTCTEQLRSWNSSSKEITPRKVKDMVITEHNQQNQNKKKRVNYKEKYDFDPRPENQHNVSESDKVLFIGNVGKHLPKHLLVVISLPCMGMLHPHCKLLQIVCRMACKTIHKM